MKIERPCLPEEEKRLIKKLKPDLPILSMFHYIISHLKNFDWYLIINIVLLMFFSLATLYSLQINIANPDLETFFRQLIFIISGLAIFIIFSKINYRAWGDYYKFLLIFIVIILLGVFVVGTTIRGTKGWLTLFGQTIQPVEFAKLFLVIFLSKFFSLKVRGAAIFKNVMISGMVVLLVAGLVILQPDLGSAMIIFFTWLAYVLILPVPKRKMFYLFLTIIIMLVIGWFTILKPYQQERILTFVNPQADPLGAGYNVTQSILAVGSGKLIGRGLSLGSQSQLNFLPEQETDFIFAVIAEELGVVGAGALLVLFFSLFLRIYFIAKNYADDFGSLLAFGILTYLIIQTFINIGMNIGIAPVAGVPLPFISAGGSSLISVLMAMGIIHSIYLQNKKLLFSR